MKKKYIGLDIGTSSVKFSVVTNSLESLFDCQKNYQYLTPQKGWSEIEPDDWFTIIMAGLKEIFSKFEAKEIGGIGITGQMHTTVFINKDGESVRPAIMWNDSRTASQIPTLKKRLDQFSEGRPSGKIISTGSPLANLLWVKENEPEQFMQISHFLIAKDYLVMKLTGAVSTDYCDASTSSLYDFEKDEWSERIQKEFDLSSSLFPPINYASKIVGNLTPESQKQLGISEAIPLVAGTGDNVASALAAGSFKNQQPLLSLGTSGVVAIPNDNSQLKLSGKNVVVKIQSHDQKILTQGTVQAGAQAMSWWQEDILKSTDYESEQAAIQIEKLGLNEVLFFPHLKGEKILYRNPLLRGAFVGLGLETSRADMYLAVLEGVGFGLRRLFEELKNDSTPDFFTLVGGGSNSKLWVQILANIFNRPMKKVSHAQEAVQGAAILAILAHEDLDIEEPHFAKSQLILPDPLISRRYNFAYGRYLKLSDALLTYTQEVSE